VTCETIRTFLRFFQNPKKHDFLLFFELLNTFSGTLTRVYISAPVASALMSTQLFISCVERIDAWMRSNRLRMNADKTQLVWLRTRQQLAKVTSTELPLLSALIMPSSAVLDLGVNIDGSTAS